MSTLRQLLNLGIQYHQSGQLQQAEQAYRQVLQADPNQVDALHLLGLIAHQVGRSDAAIAYMRQALRLKPDHAGAHNSLGLVLGAQKKLNEALSPFREALRLKPDFTEAHYNLGIALLELGKLDEAVASLRQALHHRPGYAEAYHNLGTALQRQGKLEEAAAHVREALRLRPDFVDAHNNLGIILYEQRRLDEAAASFRQALNRRPDFAEAHSNLGNVLREQGKLEEAAASYRRALHLKPDSPEAHYNLGIALRELGTLDEAVASFRQALHHRPDYAAAYHNLGNVLLDKGELDEALANYRRALGLKPDNAETHSSLVYALNFCPGYDARAIFEEHCRWNAVHAEPLAKFIAPHDNEPSPDRRLRIGYVSPDFSCHVVGSFILPLLEAHDRGECEIFCYASVQAPDAITDRCRSHADVWRNVLGLSDERVAQLIRADRIDILVDLTMHMQHNRLLVFARKPAPVQVTYLAYCGTTGLRTIDYRLTDPYLDPSDVDEQRYSERSIQLPETYWCYRPLAPRPPVNALPALQAGHVTFGCLNNFCKATVPTIELWSRLLRRVPEARLLLHARAGSQRDRVRDFLAQKGIAPGRVTFVAMVPTPEYFGTYQQIDIALDPFPYGGGTTTCDALWMGVPVVSLAGQTAVGRAGLSILSNLGLAELVARTNEEYLDIAARLARDLQQLSDLRATLRERMQKSPLMDVLRFARNIEAAYRDMWKRWCARQGT